MVEEVERRFKYSFHLATAPTEKLEDFLTDTAREKSQPMPLRVALPYECQLRYISLPPTPPGWSTKLDEFFEVDGKIKTAGAAGAILLKAKGRVLACTFGFGHTLLDGDKRESDFGLLVAANSLSDSNVKLVEKANLGSVIRDATQAAGITRLQEFNVDRALSLVRRLSGREKDGSGAISGASSVTVTSKFDIDELHTLASTLVELYDDDSYRDTAFIILDKIRPVDAVSAGKLDEELLEDINSEKPSFELGAPEITTEPVGFMTMPGSGKRVQLPDVTLTIYKEAFGHFGTIDDLSKCRVANYNVDGKYKLGEWSVYRGLVGSLEYEKARYAINEGRWYRIDKALVESANQAFAAASKGLDKAFLPWPLVTGGKKNQTIVYEVEELYNKRVVDNDKERFVLMDQMFVAVPNMPGPGIEVCDLLDVKEKRLIHVKKSGRRSSVISHFLMQGMNSAKLTRLYDAVRDGFLQHVVAAVGHESAVKLFADFPAGWTVEFKFGDAPIASTKDYTIPFFSRVTLDDVKREVEALGFKAVEVSFIKLSNPPVPKP